MTVEAGDAEDPAYPDWSFDVVLASNVMFLLDDPERAARRYAELLRPGGVFAFSWNVTEGPGWVPTPGRSLCSSRCGRRTAACAAGSGSATPGPLPWPSLRLSAPAARPGPSA